MPIPSLALDTPELAEHYEKVSADRQYKAGQLLIEQLKVASGERALDVGCGTGLLADYVATVVGPHGSVVGVDPLPLRIAIAKKRARPNTSYFVGSALDLSTLPDASFDVVYLNAVFHWIDDKALALRNFARVLKQGGRLGITTGSKEHPNLTSEIRQRVLSRPPYDAYPAAAENVSLRVSVDELRGLLQDAGFEADALNIVESPTAHASGEAAIEFSQASSFGNYFAHLPEALRPQARAEIAAELEKTRAPEGIRQGGARIYALATKR
ncbi:MAG TPA: methyltransferase domain-containing protein [Polyangiales bacterium]